ncbi:hypothetical protein Tco_0161893 [Tanacetum coccineum]
MNNSSSRMMKPSIEILKGSSIKWRLKVTTIEECKDLSTLPVDELIGNLKVYEVVLEKDLETSRNKKEKYKSLALKARKVLSEEEATSSDSNDEEYALAVRDFKKFFRRRGKFVCQPHDDKRNFQKVKEDKKEKKDQRHAIGFGINPRLQYKSLITHGEHTTWAVDFFKLQEPDSPKAAPASPDYVPWAQRQEQAPPTLLRQISVSAQIDYPADGGDGDDDDSFDDDEAEEEASEEEEDEHLALADSVVAPIVDHVPSAEET